MAVAGIHRKGEINLAELINEARENFDKEVGAMGCFVGIVRETSKKGEPVKHLHYEAAEEVETKLLEIATRAEGLPGICHARIHHVIDDLAPGEDAIYIIVGGKHRNEVFTALSQIMDWVKSEAMIWKKEITESGGYWV